MLRFAFSLTLIGTVLLAGGCAVSPSEEGTTSDAIVSSSCSVLVVMSDAKTLRAVGVATPWLTKDYDFGFLLDEMAIPVNALLDAGCRVTFTNPSGAEPPRDPQGDKAIYFTDGVPSAQSLVEGSLSDATRAIANIVPGPAAHAELARALHLVTSPDSPVRGNGLGSFDTPLPFSALLGNDGRADDAKLDAYSAVFVPGGYAPMLNLWNDTRLGHILRWFHDRQRTTATLCRGGVALASTARAGGFAYSGYRVTTYATIEDNVASLSNGVLPVWNLPFHPNRKLRDAGALVEFKPFKAHVVEDRELISGENQFSAHLLAKRLIARLRRSP